MSLISIGAGGLSRAGSSSVTTGEEADWLDEEMGNVPSVYEDIPDPDPPAPVTEISFIFCTG